MSDIAFQEHNIEQVYLVGIRLRVESDVADLYSLVLYNEVARGDANRPLTRNGRIVFFEDARDATRVLSLGDAAFRKYEKVEPFTAYTYDLPYVAQLLENGNYDERGMLADFINELLDFVHATGRVIPPRFKESLVALADRTTFDKSFGGIFSTRVEARREACDALAWCLGTTLAYSFVAECGA